MQQIAAAQQQQPQQQQLPIQSSPQTPNDWNSSSNPMYSRVIETNLFFVVFFSPSPVFISYCPLMFCIIWCI
jgi:hypothetical protein